MTWVCGWLFGLFVFLAVSVVLSICLLLWFVVFSGICGLVLFCFVFDFIVLLAVYMLYLWLDCRLFV